MANKNIVKLAGGKSALSSPSFIIEDEGRFYLTVAVVEYDPNAADMTTEQESGVEQIRKLHEDATGSSGSKVAKVDSTFTRSAMNTGPKV